LKINKKREKKRNGGEVEMIRRRVWREAKMSSDIVT